MILLFAFGTLALGQTASEKTWDTTYPDHSQPFWPKYEKVVKGAATLVATEVPECGRVDNALLFISDFGNLTKKGDPGPPITSPERSIVAVNCLGRPTGGVWFVRDGKLFDEKERARLRILGGKLVDRWLKAQ